MLFVAEMGNDGIKYAAAVGGGHAKVYFVAFSKERRYFFVNLIDDRLELRIVFQ